MIFSRMRLIVLGLLGVCICLNGCGTPVQFGLTGQRMTFKQGFGAFKNQIDVLWVIDNSGSMASHQSNLSNNFSYFINSFMAHGYDFRIAVTTTDAYLANPLQNNQASLAKFRDGTNQTSRTGIFVIGPGTPDLLQTFVTNATQGTLGSSDERAFSSFRETLSSPLNAGFVRPNSYLAVVILSDEDDFSGNGRDEDVNNNRDYGALTLDTVNTYVSYLDQITQSSGATRRYNVSAITVLDAACGQANFPALPVARRYQEIAGMTDGVLGSVCDASYAAVLDKISSRIMELSNQFYLNILPQPATISVRVNGAVVPNDGQNGWTYNSAANSIVFHGSSIPSQNAIIDVNFTPAGVRGSFRGYEDQDFSVQEIRE